MALLELRYRITGLDVSDNRRLRGKHADRRRCFVIGNGPSIRDMDLSVLSDEKGEFRRAAELIGEFVERYPSSRHAKEMLRNVAEGALERTDELAAPVGAFDLSVTEKIGAGQQLFAQ